jgi:hypothetical protein
MGALGQPVKSSPVSDNRSSRTQSTSVGSGSKPGAASIKIESSAPMNERTMDRNPPSDYLK